MTSTIIIADQSTLHSFNCADILWLESSGAYTVIHFKNSKSFVCSKNLKSLMMQLHPDAFCRIHKSHAVNMAEVLRYYKGRGGYVILSDGSTLQVSFRLKSSFLKQLNKK